MEHLNGENIMILLLAGFSGFNLFFNYVNGSDNELVEIRHSDYARACSSRARDAG